MKLLLENWREYLNEETLDLPQQIVSFLEEHGPSASMAVLKSVEKESGVPRGWIAKIFMSLADQKPPRVGISHKKGELFKTWYLIPEHVTTQGTLFQEGNENIEDVVTQINTMPMYRGAGLNDPSLLPPGHAYFISNEMVAKTYGKTAEFQLDIKNPKVVDRQTWLDTYDTFMLGVNPGAIEELADEGYDSAVMITPTPSGQILYTVLVVNTAESVI